jgi:adenylate kinase family enzyme
MFRFVVFFLHFPASRYPASLKNDGQIYPCLILSSVSAIPFRSINAMRLTNATFFLSPFHFTRKKTHSPPKKPMTDDVTGEPLIQRSDDNVETLTKRLKTFHSQTGPVVDYYKAKGLWHGIDASQSPTVVWDSLQKVFAVSSTKK